jgi:hypothetical protein
MLHEANRTAQRRQSNENNLEEWNHLAASVGHILKKTGHVRKTVTSKGVCETTVTVER